MENKELVDGKLGSVGKYDLAFKEGQLVIELDAGLGASSAGLVLKIDGRQVLDAIGKLGSIEASVVKVIEAAILPAAAPSA
jgi:hypothetical protein